MTTTRFLPCRLLMGGIVWLQLLVLLNPTSVLTHYPRAYAVMMEYGGNWDWVSRYVVVAFLSVLALFSYSDPRLTRVIRIITAWLQAGLFCALALFFGTTSPPQTGLAYLAPGIYCLWMGWVAYRNEF